MCVRVSEIARQWGVSSSYVARLVKRGMPLRSLADADSWRLANLQKPPRSESGAVLVKQTSDGAGAGDSEIADKDSPLARLKRSHKAERLAFALLEQLGEGGNAVAMRAGIHAWGEAKKRVSEAELEHAKHQLATGELMDAEMVKEIYTKFLGGLRQSLDAMPSSLATRANPSDPECAKRAIQEGVDQIYNAIQKAEGAFKDTSPAPTTSTLSLAS